MNSNYGLLKNCIERCEPLNAKHKKKKKVNLNAKHRLWEMGRRSLTVPSHMTSWFMHVDVMIMFFFYN